MAAAPNLHNRDLTPFLAEKYEVIKSRYPGEGRRKWRLRTTEAFWQLSADDKAAYAVQEDVNVPNPASAPYDTDEDPLDFIAGERAENLGIVVRADYSNDVAWKTFLEKLRQSEADFFAEQSSGRIEPDRAEDVSPESSLRHNGDTLMDVDESQNQNEDDSDSDESALSPAPIFAVWDAQPGSPYHALLSDRPTNLTVLRLLTDVNIRRAPLPPEGSKRIGPANRLVDCDGWQEVYKGKGIWVYDSRSNHDQCVRVISLAGSGLYGTATADSWRARVSHICELQVHLALGAMTIDFGGLDRYDYDERVRNMDEAERGIV